MKQSTLILAAAVLMLSGCAQTDGKWGGDTSMRRPPDPHSPWVFVVQDKYIVVDQEPIVVPREQRDFVITWSLPKGSPYAFAENGIRISEAGDEFNCGLDSDRQKYTCQFRNSKRGRYKYTINIVGGPNKIEALDPFIMN
jgi:hypothetical protein